MRVKHLGRRAKAVAGVGVVAAIAAVVPALGVLPGSPSKFESEDGNMVLTTAGNNDWATVTGEPGYLKLPDVPASTTDDSFSPGQKQDTTCPDVEGHKNPPKDDFTNIARLVEVAPNGHTFLYGATIRYAANGNASENIELKHGGGGICAGTSDLLERVAGDKMIAIDYVGGGTSAQFNILTWVTSGACFVGSHSAPCWGANPQSLAANSAEGQANQSAITAADNPISSEPLAIGQFAEFGIDLSDAGIVPVGSCSPFAQTIWESRSSGSSFVSSTKDIVRDDVGFSNCGEIKIVKNTSPRNLDQQFTYTSNLPGNITAGGSCGGIAAGGGFCLNDKDGTANNTDSTGLAQGTYHVTEGADPAGFAFDSVSCDSSHGTVDSVDPRKVNIALEPNDVITCTYINKRLTGAIKVTKTSVKGAATPLSGAHFKVCTNSTGTCTPAATGSDDLVTNAAGTACVDGLAFGDYYVTEKSPPSGYALDDTTTTKITVDNGAKCSDATFAGEAKTYTDTPLTDILVRAKSQATGGTASRVTCVNASSQNVGNSPQPSASTFADPAQVDANGANGLKPGTYTCTIVIDP